MSSVVGFKAFFRSYQQNVAPLFCLRESLLVVLRLLDRNYSILNFPLIKVGGFGCGEM